MKLRIGPRRQEPTADPGQPHRYRELDDPGAAFASGGGQLGFGVAGPVATTNRFMRTRDCCLPGCNRERHDPIHEVARP
jgi:hypothetical protein